MKKQILFLTFLSLAFVFAGLNRANAQYVTYLDGATAVGDVTCAGVTLLNCTSSIDELHPQAGQPYTYSVSTAATNSVHWFVVEGPAAGNTPVIVDLNDISGVTGANLVDDGDGGGSYILSADAAYNNPDPASASTTIQWKSFDGLANTVLLVAYVTDDEGCTDNIEVYRILPVFNFTLDINAIAQNGNELGIAQSSTADTCVSPVQSALYTPSTTPLTVPGELIMDYGENYVFFTVTAANFTHSWMPRWDITYSGTQGEVVEAAWAYPSEAISSTGSWNAINIAAGTSPAVLHSGTDLTATPVTIGSDDGSGECIVIRVRIDHGDQPENAVNDQTVTVAVDGTMYDAVNGNYDDRTLDDLHYEDIDGNTYCDDTDGFDNDWVNFLITPRPQIISTTGDPDKEFETKDDNSDRFGNNN